MANWVNEAKRQLRDLQTYAPFVRPAKFGLYNLGTRHAGLFVEPEFKLLAALAPVGLAIDVGGNWGQSVHALMRYARPRQLITFEPNPVLGAALERSFAGDARVSVRRVALSDTAGEMVLHVPRYRQFVYDGLASLDRTAAVEWLDASRMARFDPAKLAIEIYTVAIETLDSHALAPDVIKIDVQGFEEEVAKGGMETISAHQPVMIVEAPTTGFVDLAASAGLSAYRLIGQRLVPGDLGGNNTLFLSDERRAAIESWLNVRG